MIPRSSDWNVADPSGLKARRASFFPVRQQANMGGGKQRLFMRSALAAMAAYRKPGRPRPRYKAVTIIGPTRPYHETAGVGIIS
jgi:hypothetical protein